MGCSVAQGRQSLYSPFSHIKHPAFDALFDQLGSQQETYASLQSERVASVRRIERELGLNETIKKAEAEDIVTAVLLCYSASCGGDLGQLDFSVSETLPYLHVHKDSLQPCFQPIAEEWPRFIHHMSTLSPRLRQAYDSVSHMATDLRRNSHTDLYEQEEELLSGLSHCTKERTLAKIKQNMATAADLTRLIREEFRVTEGFQVYCRSLMEGYCLENKLRFVKEAGHGAFEANIQDIHRLVEDFYLAGEDFVV